MADDTASERKLEQRRARGRRYYQRHRDEILEKAKEKNRRYRQEHPEMILKHRRIYEERHRAELMEKGRERHRRRAPLRDKMKRIHGPNWRTAFTGFWQAQEGCCYLCGDPLQKDTSQSVVIDHDHSCCPTRRSCDICRRGLACGRCNKLVGLADESVARLRRIADALEAANQLVQERLPGKMAQGELF
jgi:hypothetical protein